MSRRSTSSTWKMVSTPRSAALRRAISIARRGNVDAEGDGAAARGQDRVLAGPAAHVEEGTVQRAGVGEVEKRGLRAADVPGRRRARVGVIPRRGLGRLRYVSILAQLGKRGALLSDWRSGAPRSAPGICTSWQRPVGCP